MPVVRFHRGGSDAARSIVVLSIVLGSLLMISGAFAAQPPGGAAPPAAAQPESAAGAPAKEPAPVVYKVDEEQKKNRSLVTSTIMRKPSFGTGEQEVFDTYYRTYALARWSVPDNFPALAAFRKTDLGNLLKQSKSGAIHDHLNALALDFMRKMAGECHPAARFNAMLMIGELNSVEPAGSSVPPVPLPAALPVLVGAVEDSKQIGAVKVAALIGILRHINLGGVKAADAVTSVSDSALAVIASSRPPSRSADGHAWMRKLAAEILGELGTPGASGAVSTALAGLVADAAAPFFARCTAAEALGKLTYPADAGIDPSKLAVPLGRLAADACTAESEAQADAEARAKAEAAAAPPSGLSYERQPPPGLGGPLGGQPAIEMPTPIPIVSRRRLRYRVNAASVGLIGTLGKPGGVAALAKGTAHEKLASALQQPVQAILDIIEANREDDEEKLKAMMKEIITEADKIRAVLAKPPS